MDGSGSVGRVTVSLVCALITMLVGIWCSTGTLSVYAATLDAVGRTLGWELGAVWELGPGDRRLRCVCTWSSVENSDWSPATRGSYPFL